MSLPGKILAILNLLAAVGFLFLGILDYAKRQAWADLALQREVLLQGLPLDENEPDADGRPRVAGLRPAFLEETFRTAGGSPVRTQLEEVQKVKGRVLAYADNA